MEAYVNPGRLVMVSAAGKTREIRGERVRNTWRCALEKDRLDAIGVRLSTDVAAFTRFRAARRAFVSEVML